MSKIDLRKVREMSEQEIVDYINSSKDSSIMMFCPQTPAIFAASVSNNGMMLRYVPYNERSHDLCLMAVDNDPDAVQFIPNDIIDYDILEKVVKNPMALRFVDRSIILEYTTILEDAVKQDPESIQFLRTMTDYTEYFDLCMIAVNKDGMALKYVDTKAIGYGSNAQNKLLMLYTAAVTSNPESIVYIPDIDSYQSLFKLAAKLSGTVIGYMDEEKRNTFGYDAIKNDCHALSFLFGDKYDDLSFVVAAVSDPFEAVNEIKLTAGNLMTLVRRNGLVIKNIDPKYITIQIAKAAYSQNPRVKDILRDIGKDYLLSEDPKLKILSFSESESENDSQVDCHNKYKRKDVFVQTDPDYVSLKFVRPKSQTTELCLKAVRRDGDELSLVHNQTPEICLAAIEQNPESVRFVKDKTEEICIAAIKKDPMTLRYIHDQTPEMCDLAVSIDPDAIQFVHDKTPELCDKAVKANPKVTKFIK